MVSGYFDPLHYSHLRYFRQAMNYGGFLLCVVASDEQASQKKGRINNPEEERREMADTFLRGMGFHHQTVINYLDKDTLVAEALRYWKPNVFCRGGDKVAEDMPITEQKACTDCMIEVVYARNTGMQHGSTIT